jgi:hypothetical protein
MSSQKQTEANRLNSQNAGVKTETGKSIVRHNSFKHGLTSTKLISNLQNYQETQEQFERILEGLIQSMKPRNFFELTQVEIMAKAQLKMERYDCLEACNFTDKDGSLELFQPKPKFSILNQELFELALKYLGSIQTQYYRAFEALIKGRQWAQMDLFLPEGGKGEGPAA